MLEPARQLGRVLPMEPTAVESAAFDAASALLPEELEMLFLRRQRAMHAWDITVFNDYATAAHEPTLRRYVEATKAPLRKHARIVVELANKRGLAGQ